MLIPHQNVVIKSKDVLIGTLKYLVKNKKYSELNRFVPHRYRYWTSSARNAIKLVLKYTKAKRVGVSAYTCKVVDTAIRSAGCTPFYIDSGAILDIKELKHVITQIDTLVVPYNFGLLPEIDKVAVLCKKHHVTLIEDCAAALGAEYKGRLAGTFGDYAIYSFGIGKGGFSGGMIGSKNEINIREEQKYPLNELLKSTIKGLISSKIFNPKLYPLFFKSLRRNLHKVQKTLDYKPSGLAEYINLETLKRHMLILNIRRRNANLLMEELKNIVNFEKPTIDSDPSYLYFTFKVKNREEFMKQLLKEKVEVMPLLDYQDLSRKGIKASEQEKHTLTFALYRPLSQIKFIIKKIKEVHTNENY